MRTLKGSDFGVGGRDLICSVLSHYQTCPAVFAALQNSFLLKICKVAWPGICVVGRSAMRSILVEFTISKVAAEFL